MVKSAPPKRVYIGKYLVLAAVLAATLAALLYWYITAEKRDEMLIKNVLTTLAADLSKSPSESTAAALLKVKGVAGAFAEPMTLAMDHYAAGSYDHERLLSSVGRYRAMVKQAAVTTSDITVELSDKTHAKVSNMKKQNIIERSGLKVSRISKREWCYSPKACIDRIINSNI